MCILELFSYVKPDNLEVLQLVINLHIMFFVQQTLLYNIGIQTEPIIQLAYETITIPLRLL